MTPASRRRMLDVVNAVDESKVFGTIWGTLTARPTVDHAKFRRAVAAWYRRLERRWADGRWALIWRFDVHESGALHFHFLMVWVSPEPHLVREFRPWNDQAWVQCVGVEHAGNGQGWHGTDTELLRRFRGVGFYAGKYAAKVGGLTRGRVWGVKRRQFLPIVRTERVVSEAVGVLLRRQLAKLVRARAGGFLVSSLAWADRVEVRDGVEVRSRPWRFARGQDDRRIVDLWRAGPESRACLRRYGWRVKWWEPRQSWAVRVKVWAEVHESGGRASRPARYVQHVGDEVDQRHRSSFAVSSVTAERLLRWAESEWVRRQEFEDRCPV